MSFNKGGVPRALFETMSCARSNISNHAKYLNKDDVIFVSPSNVNTLSEAIRYLQANQEFRKTCGEHARRKALFLDWSPLAEEIVEIVASNIRKSKFQESS